VETRKKQKMWHCDALQHEAARRRVSHFPFEDWSRSTYLFL